MKSTSNEKYNLIEILSENIEDLIYILNDSFECEYLNEKTHLSSIGYSCLSKKFTDYIYIIDVKKAIKFLKNILKSGESIEELRIKSNFDYKYYEVKGKRFFDKDYNAKIFLISREISKFKELELEWMNRTKKLKEMTEILPEIRFWKLLQTKGSKTVIQRTHEMLNLVIDNIPQYIYWKDVNLNYLGCNLNYAVINNLKDINFIVGKRDSELAWPKNNLTHILEREKYVIKKNKSEYSVESWILPNGNKVWFEVNRIPLHDSEKKVIGILSTYNDITNRITAEQKLSQSEQKYREILENIKEGYFEVDLNGNYIFVSKSLSEVFGYSEANFIGSNYKKFTDERSRNKISKAFNQVYKTGVAQKFLQFEFKRKDGETIILETSVNLKYDSEGKKTGFYGIIHDITDKFHLEQELKKSEEKYRLISENAYDLIFIINQNLKCEYVNEQPLFDILGYKVEEIIYNSVLNFVYLEDKELALNKLTEGLKKGEGVLELRIKHKKGNWVWIEVKGRTFTDRDGQIKGIIIGRDITERKIAEERLKNSEKKFRHLFESSPLTIWLLNSKGIIIDCNLATNQLLSMYSKDDIVNKHYTKVLSMFERLEYFTPFFQEKFKTFIKGEKMEPIEFQMIQTDGKSLWLTILGSEIKLGEETFIQVIIQNITEKKQAEEELKKLNKELEEIILERTKELRESEEKFRTITEQSSMGIVILHEGYIKYFNKAISEITGYTSEEIKNLSQNEFLQKIHEEDRPLVFEHLKRKLNGESKLPSHYTCKIITPSKEIKWVDLHSQLIKYKGNPAVLATFIDITDKKVAEEKLKESERMLKEQNLELRELDRLKTDFISIAAHELKTPLISVGGYIDLILMREKDLKLEIKEDLERVLTNCRRLENYINRLMDVMKIDAKKMELEFSEKNIYNIIESSLSELHFQINQKNLSLKLNINKNLKLLVDPFRIYQVFSNLIFNAIKFSNDGGVIEIFVEEQGKNCIFTIKDYGKGLSEQEMDKLFGKFVSISQNYEDFQNFEKGSGLGLYIARGIIEAHGGKIWVKSEGIDKGAEFKFILPIRNN